MTLSLESQRKEAEDTLTLLAAAQAARAQLAADLSATTSDATDTEPSVAELQDQLRAALAAKTAAETRVETEMTVSEQRKPAPDGLVEPAGCRFTQAVG
jgi:chemotaxis protein MotB